jgi:Spy/CpxP family protein refolding chaperone
MRRTSSLGAALTALALIPFTASAGLAAGQRGGQQRDLTPKKDEAPRKPGAIQQPGGQPEGDRPFTPLEQRMVVAGIARPVALIRVFRQLDLTDEQREKMRELSRRVGNQIPVLNRLRRAQSDALDEAIYSANFDPKVVELRAADLAATQAEITKLQARVMTEIRQILTSQQATRFRELLIKERDRPANLQEPQAGPGATPPSRP